MTWTSHHSFVSPFGAKSFVKTSSNGLSFDCNAYNYISTSQRSQVWLENSDVLGSHGPIYYNRNIVACSIFVVLAIHTTRTFDGKIYPASCSSRSNTTTIIPELGATLTTIISS